MSPFHHILLLFIITSKIFSLFFHTPAALSPAVLPSLSIKSLPPPTEGCWNRWLAAGCCRAMLVGLQEAAYLCVCVSVCVPVEVYV